MNELETSKGLEPLLILSSGRSGTTLLMQLLATSPQIVFDRVYPFEVRYLTYLLRWAQMLGQELEGDGDWNVGENAHAPLHSLGPFPHKGAELWDGQELWPRCFAAVWSEFSRHAIARTQASGGAEYSAIYYAEKIPNWVPSLLRHAMPCRLILLVRDPRDVFLSITAFDKKRGFPGFNRHAGDDDCSFAKRFVKDFRQGFKIFLEEEANPSCIVVNYEQLVLDLANEAGRLNRWLGVRLEPDLVEKQLAQFAYHMTSETVRESVERWRRELPAELNEFFLKELGNELQHLGYEN